VATILQYWIPAEDLPTFNTCIARTVKLVADFAGSSNLMGARHGLSLTGEGPWLPDTGC
jgi:hypothetical protein